MTDAVKLTPIDAISAEALAKNGLRFGLVDTAGDGFEAWFQGMTRGFHGPRIPGEFVGDRLQAMAQRRIVGVWDDDGADTHTPIATSSAWITEMTVPGERSIPSWAISTVTVAPTYRRRGIARNLLEAELRTAAGLGVPVAILTVSEATIYSRFGFAPAAMAADYRITTARARWIGPVPQGRVQLVPTEVARDQGGHAIVEAVRLRTPGEIVIEGHLWNRMFGTPGRDDPNDYRVVRYDNEVGVAEGLAIYKAEHPEASRHGVTIVVNFLAAVTDDAYSALWRYLLEIDLADLVTAKLRSVDEPLTWQVSDARAVQKDHVGDHLWARILDVKAALEARTYSAPAILTLEISDDLDFAAGTYRLEVDATGDAVVTPVHERDEGSVADLTMSVNELGAIYLGGTSVRTLVRAGRIRAETPAAVVTADAAFRSEVTPWLSTWF